MNTVGMGAKTIKSKDVSTLIKENEDLQKENEALREENEYLLEENKLLQNETLLDEVLKEEKKAAKK